MSKCKSYPAYKPSGVAWLGDIPAHWEVKRLKFVARLLYGDSLAADDREDGEFAVFGSNGKVGTHSRANTLAPAIIIGRKGSFGKVNFSAQPCFAIDTTFLIDRRSAKADVRWLFYMLPLLGLDTISQDSAVPGLSREFAHEQWLSVPPLPEQRTIAAYLDRETARIDALVAKNERLIELLQEKRTALISHAVTRGLDANAPLKDSGVAWLGKVPKHWEVKRLKFICTEPLKYGANESAELIDPDLPRFIRITDINTDGTLRDDTFRSLPEKIAEPFLLRYGDLLFARSGATVGKTFLYRDSWGHSCYAGYLVRARLNLHKALPEFLSYFASSSAYWSWVSSIFIKATIQNVSGEKYANLSVPEPSLDEQRAIAAYLDRETAKIDALVGKVRQVIEKLQEYRTALISAAVTGKIDVRDL